MSGLIPNLIHKLDLGNGRLKNLIDASPRQTTRLPFVHSTDCYLLSEIVESKIIDPHPCDVFNGEMITYLFYGKPAYRPNLDESPTTLKHMAPICVIFRDDYYPKIKRIFPFDSGAYQRSIYSNFLHKKMRLGDFGLEPDIQTPGKIISTFFGSNEAYILNKPKLDLKIDGAQFEAEATHAIMSAKGSNELDSRGTAIEAQTSETIDIKDAVAAIVMPTALIESTIGSKLKSIGLSALGYRFYDRFRPNEYGGTIHDICLRYFIEQKLIEEKDL